MKIIEKSYKNGITLGILDTDKFKTDALTLCYRLPATEYNVSVAGVLSSVLCRGTEKHKNISDINRHLMTLYDAAIDAGSCMGIMGDLNFRVNASMLDDALSLDGTDIFGGVTSFISELLFSPLVHNGEMDGQYTESEKKRLIERIRAMINNKDLYAVRRANEIAYAGTPFALGSLGTEESVEKATPKALYDMLLYITGRCPLHIVFGGKYTEKKARRLDSFIEMLSAMREGNEIEQTATPSVPLFDEPLDIVESISAKQGRMVLSFSTDRCKNDGAHVVFDEIFGASPVSRLFMNVRERLSLCYYCSARSNAVLSRVTVRSGIDIKNREKAIDEINRQINLLSDPENISDSELEIAKKSAVSAYRALGDSIEKYSDWYLNRIMRGKSGSSEEIIFLIKQSTKEEVAFIAKSMRLQLSYFLDGTEK